MSSLYVCQLKPKKKIFMFIIFYLIIQLYFIRHFSLRRFPDQRMVRRHSRPLRGSGPTFPGSNHSRRVRSQVRRRTSARWEILPILCLIVYHCHLFSFSNQTLNSSEKQTKCLIVCKSLTFIKLSSHYQVKKMSTQRVIVYPIIYLNSNVKPLLGYRQDLHQNYTNISTHKDTVCKWKEMRWKMQMCWSYDGQVNNDPTFISLIMFENISTNDKYKNADSPVILLNYRSYLWSNWDQGSPSLQVHSTGNNFNNYENYLSSIRLSLKTEYIFYTSRYGSLKHCSFNTSLYEKNSAIDIINFI